MASSRPLRAPNVTLFISGSSTYSLLMWATTSLKTPMCLRVSSALDAPLLRTLPTRRRTVRHVDVLTTKYLMRLLIGEDSQAFLPLYLTHWTHRPAIGF